MIKKKGIIYRMKIVSVVGAGVAGLAFCENLLNSGKYKVNLFEKENKIGGRSRSLHFKKKVIDHGAQYFTAYEKEFQEFISGYLGKTIKIYDSKIRALGERDLETNKVIEESKGKLLELGIVTKRFIGINYIGEIWERIVDDLKKKHKDNFQYFPETEVIEISKNKKNWNIRYLQSIKQRKEAKNEESDLTILTGTPKEIQMLIKNEKDLPFYEKVMEAKMKPVTGLLLEFKRYQDSIPFDAAFINNTEKATWMMRDSSKNAKNLKEDYWIVHFSPEYSSTLETAEEIDPLKLLTIVEEEILGDVCLKFKDKPNSLKIYTWKESDIIKPLKECFLFSKKDQLGICCDWLNSKRVEGAFMSGLKLSQKIGILKKIRKKFPIPYSQLNHSIKK